MNPPNYEAMTIMVVFIDNNLVERVPLRPDDFVSYGNEWETIVKMWKEGKQISMTTVDFDPTRLMSEYDAYVSPLFLPEYCRKVREASILRKIKNNEDLSEVELAIKERLLPLEQDKDVVGEFWDEYYARLGRIQEGHIGIKTGFKWIDESVVLRDGDLITIAARPGQGKTAFAMNVAMGIAEQKKKVLYLSLEMSEHEMMCRSLACSEYRPLEDFSNLKEEHIGVSLGKWLDKYPHLNFRHPRICSLEMIYEMASRYDCVVVDQLSCIQEQLTKGETKANLYGRITSGLKQIANQYNIPVILCAQINRQGTDEPLLHHLKDSGSIEEDSAVVLILHSANIDSPTRIICAKNRGGKAEHFEEYTFRRSHMKFF